MNVESADVIRLIEQFLREHNLHSSLDILQRESGVSLNTVENVDDFKDDILKGRWDAVLTSVMQANLPPANLTDLYEHIILELAEAQDLVPARALLRQTEPMDILRSSDIDRYLRLEQLLSRTSFDPRHAYGDSANKEMRRGAIASDLVAQVRAAPPSRLLTLLNQSIRWQIEQGTLSANDRAHDLFYGRAQKIRQPKAVDSAPDKLLATIKLPKKQHPSSVAFSPNGGYLATGSSDGFIELWNFRTGKLASDLKYQNEGAPMMMDDSVTALAFSSSGDLVCSGATSGKIKVWKVKNGSSFKRFSAAHSQSVASVCFSNDDAQILS
ncbi:Serine/threonine-protein kinase smu1, partial [Coemansia sp. RSA 2399]